MNDNQSGYTYIEILTSIAIVMVALFFAGYIFLYIVIAQGNFWYTKSSVLEKMRISYPAVSKILKDQRNIYDDSIFIVEENNKKKRFCLDSDILWSYEIRRCD